MVRSLVLHYDDKVFEALQREKKASKSKWEEFILEKCLPAEVLSKLSGPSSRAAGTARR